MKLFLLILAGYACASVLLYLICRAKCAKSPVFKAPRHRATYYILSFTWGLPMTLFGCIVAVGFLITGHRPKRYGWDLYFEIKGIGWGLELGIFFIAPDGECEQLKAHEQGHGIQNIYLGIFTPAVVSLPSAIRFWYREIRYNIGKRCKTKYDDIWFEGSASASGKALIERLKKSKKAK